MKHSTGAPTKDEKRRLDQLAALGCVACRVSYRVGCGPLEIHHLLRGNKRRGHMFTIPLGRWHHRGEPLEGRTKTYMRALYGPSLALHGKAFRLTYGSDTELLSLTNTMLL